MRKILGILFITFSLSASAQDTSIFKYPIKMDEVVISAARDGWDIDGFIKRVQNDTTFYKAFSLCLCLPIAPPSLSFIASATISFWLHMVSFVKNR